MLEKVRKAMEDLEARGINPSVRAVRAEIGGGSYTDIGEAIRKIKEERDLLNTVRTELPQSLQDKASILIHESWVMAQELANRAIEDVRHGCEVRVTAAQLQAHESLRDIDNAEARIEELIEQLEERNAAYAELEDSERAASKRAEEAEGRVGALEAEIRVLHDHANRRERELELAYRSVERMTAAFGGAPKAEPSATVKAAKAQEPSTSPTPRMSNAKAANVKTTDMTRLKDLIINEMAREPGLALSTAEVHARLPNNEDIQQRQVYNLLYRSAAAGTTFVSVGEGKFALRAE